MKILIVDDESSKLKAIRQKLTEVTNFNSINIIHVLDLQQAKAILCSEYIDLLILDLNLPYILGEETDEHAGMNFIDEIIYTDSIIKPREIIIFTAFDELKEQFTIENKYSFLVLKYNESNEEWSNKLISRVEFLNISKTNHTSNIVIEQDYDVAIITAVKTETEAVKKLTTHWDTIKFINDSTYYYSAMFGDKRVITAQQSEMGMSAASLLSSKLIYNFQPKYLIMVGIAAGIDSEHNFGDIIVPTEVWVYSNGKYIINTSGEEDFIPDPKSIPINPEIRELLQKDFDSVLYNIKKNYENAAPNELKIITGPMACGTAVVANKEIVNKFITNHFRKTIGLDMESYGVFYAAHNLNNQQTIPIIIKSICDFADNQKDDNYQKYAAYTSAKFAQYLIESELFTKIPITN